MKSGEKDIQQRQFRRSVVVACVLYVLLIVPARWGMLYLTREGLRLAAAAGIMDESRGLGGQILGYNYFRHPQWVLFVVEIAAAGVVLGAALVAAILLVGRMNGGATLCGNCGADVERTGGLVAAADGIMCCPVCRSVGSAATVRKRNSWYLWRRVIAAMVSVGVAYTIIDKTLSWKIGMLVVDAGEAIGLEVPRISGQMYISMSGGPFTGSGWGTHVGNVMYGYVPIFTVAMVAGVVGAVAYLICAGPLGRTGVFGYRGPMCCGGCGYELEQLKTPRCPECGRRLGCET